MEEFFLGPFQFTQNLLKEFLTLPDSHQPPVTIPSMTIIGHSSRRWGGHNATHMELCAAEGLTEFKLRGGTKKH